MSLATPFAVVTENQEDEGDCADVSAYMLGEVLELSYSAVFDNGNCIEVQTLIHFQDNGTATEITEAGGVLDSYSFQLTSENGQCVMTTSGENCNAPVLVLNGDQVDMIHEDGRTVTLSESSVSYGCMDADYLEYDPAATLDDGSCSTLYLEGCQDETACNYNASATDGGVTCVYTDGICETCSGETDGTGVVVDNDSDNDEVCDNDEIAGCQDAAACNYNASATDGGVTCVYTDGICETCSGETDGAGTVIDNDTDNDEVCDADEIAGCQDDTACNYNASATDGGVTCVYTDGICETCSGETDGTGTVIDNDSDDDEVCDADEIAGCQDAAACNYNASATDGGVTCVYTDGICETCSGETDGTGTVIDNDTDNDEVCDDDEIPGCTNPIAVNYNPEATDDDGSCPVGCMWADACNYDADALEDDGSCEFDSCVGCMDDAACNYDASATLSGACTYAELYQDCEGNCINDADEDGVCDEIAAIGVEGCTDSDATNYNPNATDDDGSCYVYTEAGCTIPSATNYDPNVNVQGEPVADYCDFPWSDSSSMPAPSQASSAEDCADALACNYNASASGYTECDYCLGCTDSGACNYDAEALYDDGSCSYTGCSGCTNACSSNFDDTAVIDDGSCDYANCGGCTESEADNYDAGATIDDGSCQYSGCTYPTSCNYDPNATVDDGSCSLLGAAVIGSVELMSSATSLTSTNGEISVTMDSGDPVSLEVTGLNGAGNYAFAFPGTGAYGGMAPGYYSVTAVDASSCASEAVSVIVSYDLCCDCGVSDQDADGICDNSDNCTNRLATNYADVNNVECITPGCTDPIYTEYYSEATIDDGSCATLAVGGCTNPAYSEHNPAANTDDGSCQTLLGCTNLDVASMDGYSYGLMAIGDQCWFAENLRTTLYADGSAIPEVSDDTAWEGLSTGARCDYGNDASNVAIYGRLYNWYAATDAAELCPSGWHVPTDGDWTALKDYLGANGHSGTDATALKSTSGWSNDGNGTDAFGFSALPGGNRILNGYYLFVGDYGYWWSSSPSGGNAWCLLMGNSMSESFLMDDDPRSGFSVRCLRDAE